MKVFDYLREEAPPFYTSVAIVDFKQNEFIAKDFCFGDEISNKPIYDLASLTKPLTLSQVYLRHKEKFTDDMKLLLNHKAGLISGGRLEKYNWKKQILSYKVKASETLYSDFSALRLMLEIEKVFDKKFEELVRESLPPEIFFYKDIPSTALCPITGEREGMPLQGITHDHNAYVIDQFCSHAGLFSNVQNLAQYLLDLNQEVKLLDQMDKEWCNDRFIAGWDHAENLEQTLAGKGCSDRTFGHLGFTGTSIWIDIKKSLGHIFLTNAVSRDYHNKEYINQLRKDVGKAIWENAN